MAHLLSTRVSVPLCPTTAGLRSTRRVARTRLARAARADDQPYPKEVGQDPASKFWPPRPFTEHGQPNPEDDPNPDIDAGAGKASKLEATAGPPKEVAAKQDIKTSGLSGESTSRPGGTQQGGGGEGSQT